MKFVTDAAFTAHGRERASDVPVLALRRIERKAFVDERRELVFRTVLPASLGLALLTQRLNAILGALLAGELADIAVSMYPRE